VLAWCGIEVACFALLVLTGSLAGLAAVAVAGAALLGLAATNQRRVLAVTRMGTVLLSATLRARPTGVIGPVPDGLALPAPIGAGAAVDLPDGRWWVDRSSYARLRRAREVAGRATEAQAGAPPATGGG
jgi:hypothetical protein